nr:6470_t:CDS:1 [Entrophospora candida]CAG8614731.1 9857_t:CDS:1 [Entrophospora candida]
MTQALPSDISKRKLGGDNIITLGVRFEGLYATKVAQLKAITESYDKEFADFEKEAPIAAKKDNLTGVPEPLVVWYNRYSEVVDAVKHSTSLLDDKIQNLKKLLKQ